MKKRLLAADLFCGAGGTSTGLRLACQELGVKLQLVAVNHWPVAIETHSTNHPEVQHVCAAVESVEPRRLVPGGHLDLLVASPECTHHSAARGGKPMSDQKRASAHLILRWAEALRIDAILIENVPEFRTWGPLNAKNRPIERLRGSLYQHFLEGLRILGYRVEDRILNAADYGAATTRRRLFILAKRRGRGPIAWPTPTHTPTGETTLFGKTAKWRPAREIIDWSIPGRSIFARKRPLKPATMRRILAGLEKFGGPGLQPFLVVLRQHMAGKSIDDPLPTLSAGGQHLGLCEPFLFHITHGSDAGRVHSVEEPLKTVTTAHRGELALCEPFVLQQQSGGVPRAVSQPVPTIAAKGAIGLIEPFLVSYHAERDGEAARVQSVHDPLPTVTTENRFGIAQPFIVPFLGERDGQGPRVKSIDEPLQTITTQNPIGLCEPFVVSVAHGDNEPGSGRGNGGRVRSLADPMPTVTATGREYALIEPHIVKYYGTGRPASVDDPLDTVTAHDRFGLVTGEHTGYVLDIRFRMLQPHELAAAMSFPRTYVFTGTKGDAVRMIGNAVDVRTAKALCAALLEPLVRIKPRRLKAIA
jgi:DNA (cytosine-5)-methyltransferase 1